MPIENDEDVWFNCSCREWRITDTDEKGVLEQPPATVIDHECAKIIVYRKNFGVKRYYQKK